MKAISEMTLGELAAYIDSQLQKHGINVVLSGGACVAVYSDNKYVSKDLDFIALFTIDHEKMDSIMVKIGFKRRGKYYHNPHTPFYVEFISGPPSVGQDPVGEIHEIEMETGIVRIISPTDSVKDRLAAYYYWGDQQCLEQAILISRMNPIDIDNVESWSRREGKMTEFQAYKQRLKDR